MEKKEKQEHLEQLVSSPLARRQFAKRMVAGGLAAYGAVPNGRLFFVDGNGLPPARTTSEVLRIVYAGGTRSGGFFPDGVNGTISNA